MTLQHIGIGSRMSEAVIHGDTIYLSGQVGTGTSVAAQTQSMLATVDQLLTETGSSKSHILSATVWLADMSSYAEMNEVWDSWIDPAKPPARACVESRLATPEFLVEVMITAAKA